ncbi:MarR family winged helix-turn-helix transcriptional regulator [Oryzicola mucosus]|uniref:Winged helix-turn-helix transcriptional regulator n=1 Tax=Oryzicola mucosus TaxID=2767425 RepID=A0A8J6PLC2_9HYPH|nr:MarR family winged helix-turn-helix transcriptional regulator [Oryzicola mucosus]MBD0415731.1 winged helix-turn-helix transcriptional regulator [Oryzicola mucosus]
MSYRLLIDGMHQRLREEGWHDVRPAYGFVLLATRDRSTTSVELASLLGVTKQAASKILDPMDAAGYVRRSVDPEDARVKIVELAPRGWELLAAVECIYAELEAEWGAAIGVAAVELMRKHLTEIVLAANGGEFPAIRPSP